MTLGERIKKVRKSLNLTQQDFSIRFGSTQNSLTGYETGRRNPSNAVINNICKEFNVNEHWLRTGEGDMFVEADTFSLDEVMRNRGATDLELQLIKTYFSIEPDTRVILLDHIKSGFFSPLSKEGALPELTFEKQARAKAEAYYQELLREREAERTPG